MKNVFLNLVLAISLLFAACASNEKPAQTTADEVSVLQEEHHHATPNEVALDNGEKWQANPETTEGIENMISAVNAARNEVNPDFESLKSGLEQEFTVILEKCTMKGESHDQLHNYLLPLKASLGQLTASSNKQTLEELDHYLLEYKNFFK